jgi:hypothetical protein
VLDLQDCSSLTLSRQQRQIAGLWQNVVFAPLNPRRPKDACLAFRLLSGGKVACGYLGGNPTLIAQLNQRGLRCRPGPDRCRVNFLAVGSSTDLAGFRRAN